MRLIESGQGEDVVREIVAFSIDGRAVKQEQLVFALALCARKTPDNKNSNHMKTRQAAYNAIHKVCRIPTDLFRFQKFCLALKEAGKGKGYGRMYRRAFGDWYTNKSARRLAYLTTKYVSREGWTHRDLIRLCHPKSKSQGIIL